MSGLEMANTSLPQVAYRSMAALQTAVILPEQSLALAEIFLHAAIATVLYTRDLVKPESRAFSDRCVVDLMDNFGPTTYTHLLGTRSQAGQSKSQHFKVLLKGQSQQVDHILTLLETGIFPTLEKGHLEAIQLTVCADSSRPFEVLECYTFAFTYSSPSGQANRTVSSITVSPGPHTAFLVIDAQRSFNAAIKGVLKLTRSLPRLPRRRSVGLDLFYTDDCPASFEPHGFTSCAEDHFHFAEGSELSRIATTTSSLVTGAYRVAVSVSHVDSAEDQEVLHVIPERMEYPEKRLRLDEYKGSVREIDHPLDQYSSSSQALPSASRPSQTVDIGPSTAAASTQTRIDMQTKDALQRMQRSSSKARALIPTQSLIDAGEAGAEDSDSPDQSYSLAAVTATLIVDDRRRMIVPTKMAELIIHVKALQEHGLVEDGTFDQDALFKYKITRNRQPDVIQCECGDYTDQGGVMLFCETCGTWQHQFCYGWDRVEAGSHPIDHACYRCLLLPEEKDLNDWMPTLVACRNALRYLYSKDPPRDDDDDDDDDDDSGLSDAMHIKDTVQDLWKGGIFRILVAQGLIEAGTEGRIIEANRQKGLVEYVDPMASISHLYQPAPADEQQLVMMHKEAVLTLKGKFQGFALDAIRTEDSVGEKVTRYGYYPRLAARQSCKRSASVMLGSGDAGRSGDSDKTRRPRKMSRSEMVCFDDPSSEDTTEAASQTATALETETETALASGSEYEYEEEDDDMYN